MATSTVLHNTLRRGAQGDDVAAWQRVLGIRDDGDFGPKTEAATRAWQEEHGLKADGVVGGDTWAVASVAPTLPPPPQVLRQVVLDRFFEMNVPLEGFELKMYADKDGAITTAVGCKIDPVQDAFRLPWKKPDGSLATRAEVSGEWEKVKHDPDASRLGAPHSNRYTTLWLSDDAIRLLVRKRLLDDGKGLALRYPGFPSLCADVQMALCLRAWAAGTGAKGPNLDRAIAERDFATAAVEVLLDDTHNKGLTPRNTAMGVLMLNGALLAKEGGDPDVLRYQGTP